MSSKFTQLWRQKIEETTKIQDRLGMKIDAEIIETVAVLQLLGFNTTGSCAGHTDRVTSGPYVTFESPEAIKLNSKARELGKKPNEVNHEYNRLRNDAAILSALELQKLLAYLDDFYRNRQTPYRNRLIVRSFPMTYNCLKCQGAELAHVLEDAEREALLQENRAEMHAFTEYLESFYCQNMNTLELSKRRVRNTFAG